MRSGSTDMFHHRICGPSQNAIFSADFLMLANFRCGYSFGSLPSAAAPGKARGWNVVVRMRFGAHATPTDGSCASVHVNTGLRLSTLSSRNALPSNLVRLPYSASAFVPCGPQLSVEERGRYPWCALA